MEENLVLENNSSLFYFCPPNFLMFIGFSKFIFREQETEKYMNKLSPLLLSEFFFTYMNKLSPLNSLFCSSWAKKKFGCTSRESHIAPTKTVIVENDKDDSSDYILLQY